MGTYKITIVSSLMILAHSLLSSPKADTIKCPIPVKQCIELCGKPNCGPVCTEYVQACRARKEVDWESFYEIWMEHRSKDKDSQSPSMAPEKK